MSASVSSIWLSLIEWEILKVQRYFYDYTICIIILDFQVNNFIGRSTSYETFLVCLSVRLWISSKLDH